MRHAICYVSNTKQSLNRAEILELLQFWKERNESVGIKGVLLYSEGNFFQILVGDKATVLAIFKKIEKDSRHYGLIQVMGRDITQESCDGYKVGIVNDEHIHGYEVPQEYLDSLQGISPEVKKSLEGMLKLFIATR